MICILKKKYGIEPYLLTCGSGEMIERCKMMDITCFCYDFRISVLEEGTKWERVRKKTRRLMRYKDYYYILNFLSRNNLRFDLVHSNSSIFDIGLFLSHKWNVPHIWHVREFAKEDYGLETIFSKRDIKKQYLKTDTVIAISDAIAKRVLSYSAQIIVRKVYNGIHLTEEYEKVYFKDNFVRFCIVGAIQPQKGQFDVVKACKLLEEKKIVDYQLYIVGDRGSDYYQEILNYISQNKELEEKVFFTGFERDINGFLRNMDIGIMASDFEAFGRVTVEYMANYMPVIGTNSGGTPEVIGDVGVLYTPHDIISLSNHMAQFMENRQSIRKSGILARKRASMFTDEKNAGKIYGIYEDVINKGVI